jgi:hypothetical protein
MDRGKALRTVRERASQDDSDRALLRVRGNGVEQQVHRLVAVSVVRALDQAHTAPFRQREMRGRLADVTPAGPEFLILVSDHDRQR